MFADDNQPTNDGNEPTTTMPSEPVTAAASSLSAASSYEMTDAPAQGPGTTAPVVESLGGDTSPSTATTPQVNSDDQQDLLSLKKDVLNELAPLVGHIDQSPEEKFKTTMMMLQSTDNHALVRSAYEAAKEIPDEKVRAAALLDIVNEINYFTQPA